MKKLFTLLFGLISVYASAQLKFESDNSLHQYGGAIFMHQDRSIKFGDFQNVGKYAIQYWEEGLNFFIPWPNPTYRDYALFLNAYGFLGVGRKPNYKLDVNGDIATYGTLRVGSDARFKTSIQPLPDALTQLRKLDGISFSPVKNDTIWSKDSLEQKVFRLETQNLKKQQAVKRFGFVAQDIQKVFPELVDTDANGYLNVDYIGLIPVIVEALKEQSDIIAAQSLKIKELEANIYRLQGNGTIAIDEIGTIKKTSVNFSGIDDIEMDMIDDTANAFLYQNVPNPFSQQTEISYFLPESISNAYVCIFDLQGKLLKNIPVTDRQGTIRINGSELQPGMYIYSLIADGKEADTKRMILTK